MEGPFTKRIMDAWAYKKPKETKKPSLAVLGILVYLLFKGL